MGNVNATCTAALFIFVFLSHITNNTASKPAIKKRTYTSQYKKYRNFFNAEYLIATNLSAFASFTGAIIYGFILE